MDNKKMYVDAKDVMETTGVSKTGAYQIIARLNQDLEKIGKYTVRGKVPRKFFFEKFYL